ncbi:hypothetical protein OG788_04455 [Streptomyces sp. NBC_00647]|uniref:hypothetical protein n=1 Tax=Streptomyces sp. NBC_00647 TaxID=2975796 RepID=UPI0032492D25
MRSAAPHLLVLASCLALTACGPRTDPPASDARPTSSDGPRFLPLAAYDMPEGDVRTVGRARWTLAKECMARLGFDSLANLATDPVPAWPERPATAGVATADIYMSDDARYGIQDPGQAARYGYEGSRADYERRYPKRKWTLAEYLALTGEFVGDEPKTVHGHRIPERGSLGEADRAIYGTSPEERRDPVLELESKSLRLGMRDPAWKRADKAWSACMRKAGFHYATPGDAWTGRDRDREELERRPTGERTDPDEPSALDRKTATADVRCKQRTGYIKAVHAVDVRIQKRLVTENRTELEEQSHWNRGAVHKAREVLEEWS